MLRDFKSEFYPSFQIPKLKPALKYCGMLSPYTVFEIFKGNQGPNLRELTHAVPSKKLGKFFDKWNRETETDS